MAKFLVSDCTNIFRHIDKDYLQEMHTYIARK